ncbi:MAG TPA: long-chain fatty acid--CoA ligase [Acidimicrobiia bacterium]|nr:long-chain fatty acid--CoA ligase [Acidimicrobiia bacterium]
MREFVAPGEVAVDPAENLTTQLWANEQSLPDHAIAAYRVGDGPFQDVTFSEFASQVRRVAAGLMSLGLEKGDRVCIFSPTRYEFTVIDYALWAAGLAAVTIYETSSDEQVEWIVKDSGAKAIICATDDLKKVFLEKAGQLGTCEHVFSLETGAMEALVEAGSAITDEQVMERARSVGQDDLATLVYTSGTTGRPKGCVLTVGNFVWLVRQVESVTEKVLHPGASTLMFLPLAHIFARVIQVASIDSAAKINYSNGVPVLLEELQMVRPTWMFSVPRVFEKIYNGASQKAHAEGKGKIFDLAAKTAIEYSEQAERGRVSIKTRALHGLFDKLVYGRLRDVFGGRCEYAISGGAALGSRLGHFFSGIGLKVLEGYGLTETTAGSTVNRPDAISIGSVGLPIPGVGLRIADDGEVLIKGRHIFQGYWNNPEATAEVMDGVWFRSGDIGQLDDRGFLSITGRKKEIIVTAGGKNVAPAVLEDRLRAHPLISQAMVVGDNQPFIATLITIDPDEFPRWAAEHEKMGTLAELIDDEDLLGEIGAAVEDANRAVSKAESIRSFRILPQDFTIEGGELTPTLKVKRRVVTDRYGDVIDGIYAG